MQNYKKVIVIILTTLLIIPLVLCACEQTQSSTSSDNTSSDASSDTKEDDWEIFTDATGLERKDWSTNGTPAVVKFLTYQRDDGYYNREITSNGFDKSDEYYGEAVYEAVAERTNCIEDYFGIKVEVCFTNNERIDDWLQLNAAAGISEYQLVAETLRRLASSAKNGYLYNISTLDLDLSKSFWDQTAINDLSLGGNTFFITGDIFVSDNQATWACFFNKDIIDDYNFESPYDLVENNKWTIDTLYQMAKEYGAQDFTANDWEHGHYGLVAQTYDGISSMAACNTRMITKDSSGSLLFNMESESLISKFEKVYELLTDKTTTIVAEIVDSWNKNPYEKVNMVFFENRALFQYQKLQYVNELAEYTVNFGLVPMPKYDSQQDNYYTTSNVYYSQFVAIPANIDRSMLEITAYTLQLMAYYGQKYLTPAYYDVTIKSQKTQDIESEDMLDIIFQNRIYDIAATYNFSEALYIYTNIITSSSNTLVSSVAKNESKITAAMQETLEAFERYGK